uniref:HicA toxin of toxin-antitoxin n=1 Tax=Candidatus Kentrum sp. FW TaxID=2126338 RepID=A0A450TE64_9GAMM|nr:MAG: HicA toxin of toxin-antitoxin [Candidatus Kentron sp. FW]
MLLGTGFERVRTKGSHGIYRKGAQRFVIPFYKGKTLHPRITRDLMGVVENGIIRH